MKKGLFFAVAATMLASCASDELVDVSIPNAGSTHSDIRFTTNQKNMTRSWTELQKAGHYNFGVFAYKSTDLVNPVMPNYLVGYYDEANGYQKSGTTWGDPNGQEDGLSYWMYEGMGSNEYNGTYAGSALTPAFTSNNTNQYLKYWDKSAAYTNFIAYSPYINGGGTATYVDGTAQSATGSDTRVLTIPNGTLKDGYNDPSLSEYMYASAHVLNADYGHDVALQFHRLNAKVNIKFWEDVPGYKVRILTLQEGKYDEGVYAAASIHKDNDHSVGTYGVYGYRAGQYYTANGVKIQFDANATKTDSYQYEGTTASTETQLKFAAPAVAQIGENRYAASASATTYYAIPKGSAAAVLEDGNTDIANPTGTLNSDLKYTGFTFHVTYELTAEDTGETIKVSDATVHVPADYCNWKENTHYTYIFKITKNSNGTTVDPTDPTNPDVDPSDPEVPEVQSLYPIVFDNCTVVDWDENVSEWEISEGNVVAYHDIQLSVYSLASNGGTIHIDDITDKDTYSGHAIDWTNGIKVYDPSNSLTDYYQESGHNIVVPSTAAAGVYTVEYTCPAPAGAHATHPQKWTEHFLVKNAYTISTALTEVATNGNADATLVMTATMDATDVTSAAATAQQLSIDYPKNFTSEQKANVYVDNATAKIVVKKGATPGKYQLVYIVDEGPKVMVAKTEFDVVDKSFDIPSTITNKLGGNTIVASQAADATHVYTVTGGFTVTGNSIEVPNNTTEGSYTVTYTVDGGTASEVVYTKSFTVKNQYSVTLAKDNIDSKVGTSATGDVSTDGVVVTLKNNEVATDTDLTSSLKVVASDADNTAAADANFSFVWDGTAKTITLKVKRGAAKKQYKVVYTGQTTPDTKYAVANFVVK